MDNSKEYIKMCEKATEIQKLRDNKKWVDGDFFIDTVLKSRLLVSVHSNYIAEPYLQNHSIWLPRQDQLQDMVKYSLGELHYRFYGYIQKLGYDTENWTTAFTKFASMEQLWLAFVMKEKYSKQWSTEKEEWIEEKDNGTYKSR